MRDSNKLTAIAVKKMSKPDKYPDGLNLYLQVAPSGAKSWLFRYSKSGQPHWIGLGALHTVSLAEARIKARDCRKLLADGGDPLAERKAAQSKMRVEAARGHTFRECAEKLIASHEAGWRNEKHRQQWKNTLATYAYPIIGDLAVADIDTALVLKVVELALPLKSDPP